MNQRNQHSKKKSIIMTEIKLPDDQEKEKLQLQELLHRYGKAKERGLMYCMAQGYKLEELTIMEEPPDFPDDPILRFSIQNKEGKTIYPPQS